MYMYLSYFIYQVVCGLDLKAILTDTSWLVAQLAS